jgi:hemerythrin superfamily protein
MTQNQSADTAQQDVIDLLLTQHAQVRQLFDDVIAASDEQRKEHFDALVRLLAVHETAEEEVVHPLARRVVPDDATTVDDRLTEEREAKELLSRLDGMDTNDEEFDALIIQLRDAVMSHAANEEREEFTWLREKCEPATLRQAATAVRAAEAAAPTHPHPGIESAAGNLVAGPMAAVVDRVRDAIRTSRNDHTSGN